MTLDRTDAVALARLMEEGRVSWAELAKALRLSPAASSRWTQAKWPARAATRKV